jgi:hypothetical protein
MSATRNAIETLAEATASAFKARKDIEALSKKLRTVMRKVDAVRLNPGDRQRLADELSRLSGEAQWFADQVTKGARE